MSESGRSSIVGASVWMLVVSLLLFWLPFVGPLLGGIIGGRKAGGVVRGLLAGRSKSGPDPDFDLQWPRRVRGVMRRATGYARANDSGVMPIRRMPSRYFVT
jgi:hypothetical protein